MAERASIVDTLESTLGPVAERAGFELVAVEIAGSAGSPIVRVYLDKDGGVDLDAIADASRWVSETLDASDPFSGSYTLEVSSPGVDRPLRKLTDYERFTGSRAVMKTVPVGGRSSFKGLLAGVEGDAVIMDIEGTRVEIPFDAIRKAHLKGEVDLRGDRE